MLGFPPTMLWPLLAALVLTGIHVYFGIHVIGRKVIFVDLALAQIAALGAAFGVVMGYNLDHHPWGLYGYSLAFCILAAAVFSMTRMKSKEIPHEAIVGIAYAVAVAVTMIVLARSPLGPQEFDRMMKGQLLWVTPGKVLVTSGIYAAVGMFHALFWKRFAAFSFGDEEKEKHRRWLWDFLFYASFGFVVTSSVAIAGIFLVFCFLIIPAVGALLFSRRLSIRLVIGWAWGSVVSVLGIMVSYKTGWPTSPTIVVAFAATLIAAAVVKFVAVSPSRGPALARVGIFSAGFALFIGGLFLFRHRPEDPFARALQMAHEKETTHRLTALGMFGSFPERADEWEPCAITLLEDGDANVRIRAMELLGESSIREVSALLRDPEDHVRERCVDLLHELENPVVTEALIIAGDAEKDSGIRLMMYEVALHLGDRNAVDRLLAACLDEELPSRRREKARMAILNHVDFQCTTGDIGRFKTWWNANRDKVAWKEAGGRHLFVLKQGS